MRSFLAKPAPVSESGAPAANPPVRRARSAHTGGGHDFSRIPTHGGGAVAARTELRPHSSDPATERAEAAIYAAGKTPVRVGGQLLPWGAAPLGAAATGRHLTEIERRFGEAGVQRSLDGLAATRGAGFAQQAALQAGLSPAAASAQGGPVGRKTAAAIDANSPSERLPESVRGKLGPAAADIAIHNDDGAHRAAALLNARAFTVGRAIYFGRGQYQPYSSEGLHLLAHEAAHVSQQGGRVAAAATLRTGPVASAAEHEAERFAGAVSGQAPPAPLHAGADAGLIHRVISFTHGNHRFHTANIGVDEDAAGFNLNSGANITFQWDADVTIHGVAGDPFGNFVAGFMQVERVFYVNCHWAEGTPDHTLRTIRPDAPLPRRDAFAAGNNFMWDDVAHTPPAFGAAGDVRSPMTEDTPSMGLPWANPVAGRGGTTGWFNYADGFVTYLSVRDTVANDFRHLANVYWNMSVQGQFNSTRAVGARVVLAAPGPVHRSGVIEGVSGEFPPIIGGNIANGHDTTTDT